MQKLFLTIDKISTLSVRRFLAHLQPDPAHIVEVFSRYALDAPHSSSMS